jgi:hypothetical protein
MEQDCDGLSVHAFDTTRWSEGVERNVPECKIFFAIEGKRFSSSPHMVQLNIFEKSH